jgi:hypothetical protein
MSVVMLTVIYAECLCDECHHAECYYAECCCCGSVNNATSFFANVKLH